MRLVLIGIVVLLTACGGSAQPVARDTVTISGTGITTSRSFSLEGDYSAAWTARTRADNRVGCYHGATLRRDDGDRFFETLASSDVPPGAPATGSTHLRNLARADYFIDASSGCEWTFTFTPA